MRTKAKIKAVANMKFVAYVLALILPAALIAAPQKRLEIIGLKHRLPLEITPIIKPLLAPQDTLSSSGNALILHTDERTLNEVKLILRELDRPLKNMIISVRHRGSGAQQLHGHSVTGQVSTGAKDRAFEGNDDSLVTSRFHNRTYSNQTADVYKVRVIEGHHAFIQLGQSSLYPRGATRFHPYGITALGGFEVKGITSGFDVVARLNDDIVILHIRPLHGGLSPRGDGSIDFARAETVISGRLGEWLTLGGKTQYVTHGRDGLIYSTARDRNAASLIEVRVELAD